MKAQTIKTDIYTQVTDTIIAALEKGTRPWSKPWTSESDGVMPALPLRASGQGYRGINILLLWDSAIRNGFTSNIWMTYKQADALKANVRKGEKGSKVVYADKVSRTETDDKGEKCERAFAFMKAYTVFNVDQIEELPEHFFKKPVVIDESCAIQAIAAAEVFFSSTGAEFRHGGSRAFYSTAHDFIQMPNLQAFKDAEGYTATKAHELIHWTGNKSRLDREFGKRFGDKAYAFEELVAELGSAFLCASLGLTEEPREDHAAYLASWLQVLKEDKKAIFAAASGAQRAADYLFGLQADEPAEEEALAA